MENRSIIYEDQAIPFVLIRKKVKNLNLKVRPDQTVVISANKAVPIEFIDQFIREKAPWILKNQKHFAASNCKTEKIGYNNGDTIYLLGCPYLLEILPAVKNEKAVLKRDRVSVFVKDRDDFKKTDLLISSWYKEIGKIIFQEALERLHDQVSVYGIEKPFITVRSMKTRWGSCSWSKRKITLNTELLKKPESCIDYVVLHELAHFIYHRHDQAFYDFMTAVMPDWKERRKLLKTPN